MLLCHLWIWRKNISNLKVQIVFKTQLYSTLPFMLGNDLNTYSILKLTVWEFIPSLITCSPVCIIINLNFYSVWKGNSTPPPWLSFLFFTSLPSRSYLCPSQLPKEELSGTKAGFAHWIIESFFSRLTFSFYSVVHFFSLLAISLLFMSWPYGLNSERTIMILFEVRIC